MCMKKILPNSLKYMKKHLHFFQFIFIIAYTGCEIALKFHSGGG